MTREEFVRKDSWILAVIRDRCELTRAEKDYLNILIEVLGQKPCEDCISRQAVLERIDAERKYLLELKMDGAEHIVVHHARRIIEDMSPVTPTEPKIGHWIDIGSGQQCSECGEIQHGYDNHRMYCAYCGTKMEG